MNDPRRLLDEGMDCSTQEREMLLAGRDIGPPAGAKESTWIALQGRLPPGGGDGGGGNGLGSSGGSPITQAMGGLKGALFGVAGVATLAGAIAALLATSAPQVKTTDINAPRSNDVAPISSAESPPANIPEEIPSKQFDDVDQQAATDPPIVVEHAMPAPVARAKLIPNPPAPPTDAPITTPKERSSRLREENQLLIDARQALRGGNPAAALEKLDAAGGQFPDGVLAQEREVLAIDALARGGQRAAASDRANAFLAKYPTSPHATKVRGFVQP